VCTLFDFSVSFLVSSVSSVSSVSRAVAAAAAVGVRSGTPLFYVKNALK